MLAIQPIILPVRSLPQRGIRQILSETARASLGICAKELGIPSFSPRKDASGRPVVSDGFYWSVSHKKEFVCGVLSRNPVGIDVEKVRDVRPGMEAWVAGPEEWAMFRERNPGSFFRLWTAKEGVLKANGLGLTALRQVRVVEISASGLLCRFSGESGPSHFQVAHHEHAGHLFAVAYGEGESVTWRVSTAPESPRQG